MVRSVNTYVKRPLIAVTVTTLLLCSSLRVSGSPADTAVSFAEAWQQVVAENDTLAAARENVEQAKYKQDAAKDLYLPEIGISANYLYLNDEVTLSPADILESMPAGDQLEPVIANLAKGYGMSAAQINSGFTSTIAERSNLTSSIQAQWPIYAGGRIDAAQDVAGGQLKEANQQLEMKLEEQFGNLARTYFGVVLTKRVFDTRVDVEAGLKKHRDHSILLQEQGQIAKVERMQSEASYDKATVERRKASADLQIARLALTRLLKRSQTVSPSDALFINDTMPPLASFLDKTLASYPGLGVLDSKKEQAAGLLAMEKGKYLPTVAVFANYNLYEQDDLATELLPDWVAGVGIHFSLLERSGRSGNLKAARSMIKQINALQLQVRSDLSVLVEKSYRQAEQAREEYNGLGSSLKLAEETVDLRAKAFSQGLSTSLDVIDAELFLAEIKTRRTVAVYNHVVAMAQLYAVSGEPQRFLLYQNSQATEVR